MVKIKQASLFGRIGTGIGQGISQAIPEEITRGRLASGLKELSQQQDLTPFQQFSALASIPGMTPQMIQSGAELLRQQGIAQGFKKVAEQNQQQEVNPLRQALKQETASAQPQVGLQQNPSGLVSPQSTQAALQPYLPKTRDQLLSRAADLYDQNRQLYPTPDLAMQGAVQEDAQLQARNQAEQAQRQSQLSVEERLKGQLQSLRQSANAQIPDNVYQQVENDMLDKVGEGKGELQAAKEGQKKIDEISRQYQGLNTLGNWTFPLQSPKEAKRSIESLRKDFKERKDLENFADSLVGRNGLSNSYAYQLAYPIEDYPALDSFFKELPRIEQTKTQDAPYETQRLLEKLVKSMGKEGSPLAIAQELSSRNYDPDTWLNYLTKNKRNLDLTERQARELDKPRNFFPTLNDIWLYIGSGLQNKLGF